MLKQEVYSRYLVYRLVPRLWDAVHCFRASSVMIFHVAISRTVLGPDMNGVLEYLLSVFHRSLMKCEVRIYADMVTILIPQQKPFDPFGWRMHLNFADVRFGSLDPVDDLDYEYVEAVSIVRSYRYGP